MANYLFAEIAKRKSRYPKEKLVDLGIGDTTLPLSAPIVEALTQAAKDLGNEKSYSGYESSFGRRALREAIAKEIYQNRVSWEEIFISDGAKCDIARLQYLFSPNATIALQDPSYPAYMGASKISGKENLLLLPCTPENDFCPDPVEADLIYLCSPNNPTGHVMRHEQLTKYVTHAQKRSSCIIFDTAYSAFIQDPALPRSIYEIPGAEEVAIETGSFSKSHGFTGVRLGWLVVPKAHVMHEAWKKITSTCFNGASNLAQSGGLAALSKEGQAAAKKQITHYMNQAKRLKEALPYKSYGSENAPYLWVDLQGKSSWEEFERYLTEHSLVTTPGVGFGPSGEGFLRLSAFAKSSAIEKAIAIVNKRCYTQNYVIEKEKACRVRSNRQGACKHL